MNQENIRNFCIIAHIDHGKSTLADRLLQLTGTVESRKMKDQMLDQMDLERERGITIKLQPVRMTYKLPARTTGVVQSDGQATTFQLNLIDTPGHVDFTYEVSRSLAACEGAVLVVDASQGVQAQTLANMHLALEHGLKIIPVVNKIDLPNARPEEVAQEIKAVFGFTDDEILFVSAKTGEGVEEILKRVIEFVPSPQGDLASPLQALIYDSNYDKHRGVIAYIRIVNGCLEKGEEIKMMRTGIPSESLEVGYFSPSFTKTDKLSAGEVGYVVTNSRELENVRVGDTITTQNKSASSSLPGYKEIKQMVFASIFPESGDDFADLRVAMEKLKLNDASLSFEPERAASLGFGFRVGFLGLLHMDIIQERLHREFNLDLLVTTPSVAYQIKLTDGEEKIVYSPSDMPDPTTIENIKEPWVKLDVLTPQAYIGAVMELVTSRRGEFVNTDYLGSDRVNLHFEIPLANIISDFYDKLKSVSSGYASMNYEISGYRESDLVKLDILVADDKVDAFSMMVHKSLAEKEGRLVVEKLKQLIPKQQFAIAIQAAIGSKIIARETISPLRKDVTAKLYGGDVTRKMKLLKKQKEGKKRMKKIGKVEIPQKAFIELLRR